MKKRFFQILDEMNHNDETNGTATVAVCDSIVGAQKVKQGGHVTMGVPESVVLDLLFNKGKIPILLIVDVAEYKRIEKGQADQSREGR